jgi:hypothetical protein
VQWVNPAKFAAAMNGVRGYAIFRREHEVKGETRMPREGRVGAESVSPADFGKPANRELDSYRGFQRRCGSK